jgi:hypothetical protein
MLKLFDEINNLSGVSLSVSYNENDDSYSVNTQSNIKLNKVYAFSFMRFVVRMAQRNWFKKPHKNKKELDKTDETMLLYESSDHPDQMKIF